MSRAVLSLAVSLALHGAVGLAALALVPHGEALPDLVFDLTLADEPAAARAPAPSARAASGAVASSGAAPARQGRAGAAPASTPPPGRAHGVRPRDVPPRDVARSPASVATGPAAGATSPARPRAAAVPPPAASAPPAESEPPLAPPAKESPAPLPEPMRGPSRILPGAMREDATRPIAAAPAQEMPSVPSHGPGSAPAGEHDRPEPGTPASTAGSGSGLARTGSGGGAEPPGAGNAGGGMGSEGGAATGGGQMAAIGGARDEGGTEYAGYLAGVRQRVQASLRYPPAARRRGLEGTVHVEIVITPTGAVGPVTIVRSSSHALLDDAAIGAVRDVPAQPFPRELAPRTLRVRLPVVFQLR